jgi:hypothetical protein
LNAKTWWIAPLVLASSRAISLAHWPLFYRSQSSAFFSRDNPGRPIFAKRAPPNRKLNQKVLRRSVEPAVYCVEIPEAWAILHFRCSSVGGYLLVLVLRTVVRVRRALVAA